MQSNWQKKALCFEHPERYLWFSYKKAEVDMAKAICKKCPVRKECFISAWESGDFYGVYGGISEFDYLSLTWREVKSEKENNRTRSNRVLKGILQEFG